VDATPAGTANGGPQRRAAWVRRIAERADAIAPWLRRGAGLVVTVLAGLLLLTVLLAPNPGHVTVAALLRIPVEGLIGVAVILALPSRRARRIGAATIGIALGLWAVLRVVDIGFDQFLGKPFDPVLDWGFLDAGVDVVRASHGRWAAVWAVIGAVVAAVVLVALVTLAVLRLAPIAVRHRAGTTRTVAVLAVVWVVCAATGARVVPGEPVAAHDYLDRLGRLPISLGDSARYEAQLAVDAYRYTPGSQLLTALRGKDVLVVLVESYGRVAIEHPDIAPVISDVLASGADRLAAAGFASRSAFLTSAAFGGGSWFAHATLLSGTWVDNQQRYSTLAGSDRLTLSGAFQRAGWRTVGVLPGVTMDWPEGQFYGFDQIRAFEDLDYAGPLYGYRTIPDQYVLSFLQRTERAATHDPMMAVVTLTSSHVPWSPVPDLLDWDGIGDGASFPPPAQALRPAESVLRSNPSVVRTDYAQAVAYSLASVVSYVEKYGDDDLVLVFLGDHQPFMLTSGDTDSHDVPISIVTRDPAVLSHIAGWNWQDGLMPSQQAPVWPMDSFRDHFLSAFA
jgi:hypothetical protein